MGFLIVLACGIVGFLLGGMSGGDDNAALGFFAGLAIGLLQLRLRGLAARIDDLRSELHALRPPVEGDARGEGIVAAPVERAASAADMQPMRERSAPAAGETISPAVELPTIELPEVDPPLPDMPGEPQVGRAAAAFDGLRRWFTEGNVPVKVGMLILFAGVAALLRYASDQGWLRLPIELRLAGVALAAIGALAFGWRERLRRRSFGLALQGGAIGVLLLTVFAAFRLYGLLPAGAAFALLLVLVAGAGVLAVLQDALALAVLGILAGFAAPILVSTGQGSHVVLFSYYALLNLAILAIAWVRPWRALNLLGFLCTFAIGTGWGVLRYDPALFRSTEPFLLLNFAIYLAIPILYARRREPELRDPVDGTLVFGTPLVCFALQAALLDGERMPLAYSALVLALVYALLGWWQLPRRRVLGESYAVLAAGFATLAVPLALSARSTACTFALEGAALVWLGLRQRRLLPEASGWILQALAAGAFLFAALGGTAGSTPVANATCIGALLIATAAFASAWLYWRAGMRPQLGLLAYLWGLAWWIGAGLREIDRFVPASAEAAALLAFAAATAALAGFAFLRTRAGATAWTAAVALAAGNLLVLAFAQTGTRPFEGWGLAAFAAYAAAGLFVLRTLAARDDHATRVAHIGWLWCWSLATALALHQYARDAGLASGWITGASWLPLLLAWALALLRPAWIAAPLRARFDEWRGTLLLTQAALAGLVFTLLLAHAGDTAPITFVPLLNPVELLQLGAIACATSWLAARDAPDGFATNRPTLLSLAGFAFVTAATLRAVHQLGGVAWDESLLDSHLAQTALTVVWSVLGVLGWVLGSRRGQRTLWLAGAVLMAVVLAKLLLVDRGHLGNLFGIVSFIAYGLLCTVIGYFAPAPPRAGSQEAAA
jgi:uncharacterized membrane protein